MWLTISINVRVNGAHSALRDRLHIQNRFLAHVGKSLGITVSLKALIKDVFVQKLVDGHQ